MLAEEGVADDLIVFFLIDQESTQIEECHQNGESIRYVRDEAPGRISR